MVIKKNTVFVGTILIIAVTLFLFFGSSLMSVVNVSGVPMTVESITAYNASNSKITFVSNDAELNSINFQTVVQLGNTGNDTLSASDLGEALQGAESSKTFDIKVSKVLDYMKYDVVGQNNVADNIYRYGYTEAWLNCPTNTAWALSKDIIGNKFCITKTLEASTADLGSGIYFNQVTTQITAGGVSLGSYVIDNVSNKTVNIYNSNKVYAGYVQHLGESSAPSNSPSTNLAKVVVSKYVAGQPSNVKLTSASDFTNYKINSQRAEAIFEQVKTYGWGNASINLPFIPSFCFGADCSNHLAEFISAANNSETIVLNSVYKIPTTSITTNQYWSGANYIIEPVSNVFKYPRVMYRLSASSLGVVLEVGTPTSVSTIPSTVEYIVGSPTNKTVNLLFTSTGGKGNYSAKLINCNSLTTVNSTSPTVFAEAQGNITLTVFPQANTKGNYTCEACVYNTSKPTLQSCVPFNVVLSQIQNCVPNSYDVQGLLILKCNSSGSKFEAFKTCTTSVIYNNGVPSCSNPVLCGNGVLNVEEQCDGVLLNNSTCASLGLGAGTLKCGNNCIFDSSLCKCPEGQILSSGVCIVKDSNCDAGFEKIGSDCAEMCEVNETRNPQTLVCESGVVTPEIFNWNTILIVVVVLVVMGTGIYLLVGKKGKRRR
jgi:hypothetical protein